MATLAFTVLVVLHLIKGRLGFPSTSGREFVVTFQENEVLEVQVPAAQCITLTSYENDDIPVQVMSLYPSINFNRIVTINHNTSEHVCFDNSIQLEGNGISNKVVKITATKHITVMVHDVEIFSADSYIAIPVESYGTDYYIMSYWDESQFSVAAVENDTTVKLKFPITVANENFEIEYNGVTLFNPTDIVLVLQAYEVFQLHMNHDLTGVFVSADKEVSVVSGNRKIQTYTHQNSDHLAEQMPPVDTWGTHFTSVPSPGKTGNDIYTILASISCTSVDIGKTHYFLEKQGEIIRLNLSSTVPILIVSDKPVLVTKIIVTNLLEPCMMNIVPQRQWLGHYTFRFPEESPRGGYLIVVVETQLTSLLLNNQPIQFMNWEEIENSTLSIGYMYLDKALYTLHSTVPGSFAAYIQHQGRTYAYCCHLGMKLETINWDWSNTDSATPCSTTTDTQLDSFTDATTPSTTYPPDWFTTEEDSPGDSYTEDSTDNTTWTTTTVDTIAYSLTGWIDETTRLTSNFTAPGPETCFTTNPRLLNLSVTDGEFLNIIEELKQHLKVVPQKTSQAIRKKISVPDYRPSSTTIGTSCWIVVAVVFVLCIFVSDLLKMVKDCRYGVRK